MENQLDCALDLMRRLPPQQIEKNLCDLIDLVQFAWFHLFLFIVLLSETDKHRKSKNWHYDFHGLWYQFLSRQVPSLCEDLLSSVDQPLKIARDKTVGKDYLLCDYNRDGDSYRFDHSFVVITNHTAQNMFDFNFWKV